MLTRHLASRPHALCLLLLLPICCKEKHAESLSFSERSTDFGERRIGDTLNHTFTINNKSKKTLQIKGIETACSCTVGHWSTNPIVPDSSGSVSIQMIVKDTGFQKKSVIVEVDRDSVLYPLVISVTGKN
jgi:hypothetical protein